MPESPVPTVIRTLRFKVRREGYAWLEAAAVEVNQTWNWANSVSAKAARPFAGPPRWLSGFDLDKLSAGATKYFEYIGADTIQKVNAEFARRRRQFRKTTLRWRVSRGRRKSLGWIPMKAASLRRKGRALRFCGKTLRVFESERFLGIRQWRDGWGLLRTQLQYKGEHAGRSVRVVSERNTSRTCSACGARTGPAGVYGLRVRL